MSLTNWKKILGEKELQEAEKCISWGHKHVLPDVEAIHDADMTRTLIVKMANQLDKTDIVISDYKRWEQESKDCEVSGVDRPISKADVLCLLGNIPTGKLDNHEQGLVSAILRHFRDCVIGTADDNEGRGTLHTTTDKPTIKDRMNQAKQRMQSHNTEITNGIHYWTGYFTALVEIRNGDIADYHGV